MKKWTNKFYRDFEGQAKIGCSSLCVAVAFYKENAREETFSFFNIYSEHHLNIIYMSVWNLECLPQYLHSLVDLSIELRQFERGEGLEVYTQLNRGIRNGCISK